VENTEQLFFPGRVLLGVVSKCRTSVPTVPASIIRNKRTPHQNVRPPLYRGPSLRLRLCFSAGLVIGSGKAYSAIEGHGSGTVNHQHDRDRGKRDDVVVDSESLMNADNKQRNEHVDRDQSCGEAREQADHQ
jgi:hypothetical protein